MDQQEGLLQNLNKCHALTLDLPASFSETFFALGPIISQSGTTVSRASVMLWVSSSCSLQARQALHTSHTWVNPT